MIEVTRLNGETFYINPHQIEYLERTPDTIITFASGRKSVVKNSIDEIRQKTIEYRRKLAAMGQEL